MTCEGEVSGHCCGVWNAKAVGIETQEGKEEKQQIGRRRETVDAKTRILWEQVSRFYSFSISNLGKINAVNML